METAIQWYADTAVMEIAGMLDHDSSPVLKDELMMVFQKLTGGALVLDLGALDYISSSGLKVVLNASKAFKDAGRRMFGAAPQPMVLNMLEVSHANLVLQVFPTVRDALSVASKRSVDEYDAQAAKQP